MHQLNFLILTHTFHLQNHIPEQTNEHATLHLPHTNTHTTQCQPHIQYTHLHTFTDASTQSYTHTHTPRRCCPCSFPRSTHSHSPPMPVRTGRLSAYPQSSRHWGTAYTLPLLWYHYHTACLMGGMGGRGGGVHLCMHFGAGNTLCSVRATKSESSSSFKPFITTQFTYRVQFTADITVIPYWAHTMSHVLTSTSEDEVRTLCCNYNICSG